MGWCLRHCQGRYGWAGCKAGLSSANCDPARHEFAIEPDSILAVGAGALHLWSRVRKYVFEKSMKNNHKPVFAWIFFGLIAASVTAAVIFDFSTRPAGDNFALAEIMTPFVPVSFAFVGALIISRQPSNVIGLLMMLPGLSLFFLVDVFLRPYLIGLLPPPESPTPVFLLILWFSNWNWLLLVYPLMFIMVLFPTGRPLTPRWRWLIYFGVGLMVFIVLMTTFTEALVPAGSDSVDWRIDNPIGFLKEEWINTVVSPFIIALPVWIILCAVSLLIRFRRARGVEREQIKWLFYAAAIFALSYVPALIQGDFSDPENIWTIFMKIGMLAIPIAIAFAILRYRLYDIDIIIRRTLQYALLTGLLALVYFGSVVLLQSLVENITGRQSPIVIVISTLAIAALFNPLRIRVQDFIDRRFFRKSYDAEQTLARFAVVARDEVDMDKLSAALLNAVEETIQPEMVNLWLQPVARLRPARIVTAGQ